MRAFAPGKLVLSGAYSVLAGAPAIVSAVDRYVMSDSSRPAELVTPEVRAALGSGEAPFFDASGLWENGRKLGLGSSAAILVASLAALEPSARDEAQLRQAIHGRALRAHRAAQGGGSGVDVATSVWGGTLVVRLSAEDALEVQSLELPPGLIVEAWASGVAASTPSLLGKVAALKERAPREHAAIMAGLKTAAERAAGALAQRGTRALMVEIEAQRRGLGELGRAAGANIITDAVERLAAFAQAADGVVIPSGAGGGDIVLWIAEQPSSRGFRELAAALDHHLVPLQLHARGVHRSPSEA